MKIEIFKSAWDALEDDPVERANLKMRSELLITLDHSINRWKVTQKEAATRLGITQPRLNDLLRGKINKFSLDALIGLADHAGLNVRIKITRQAA